MSRRLLASFDLKRTTDRALARIQALLDKIPVKVIGEFVCAEAQDPITYSTFRRTGEKSEQQRKANKIPPEEVANALLAVLQQNISLSQEDLIREAACLLGFPRLNKQLDSRMSEGFDFLQNLGKCRVDDNGRVELI